jgi:hypothetical protein
MAPDPSAPALMMDPANTSWQRELAWHPCGSACDDRSCDGGVRLTNFRASECQDAQCARTVVVVGRPVTRA